MKYLKLFKESVGGSEDLISSARGGDVKEVERLIRSGVDLDSGDNRGRTALMWASYENRVEVVKLLIEAGADLDIRDNVGFTTLIWASFYNRIEVVKLLISAGANLNIRSDGGHTALIWASYWNHVEVVKLLLENFADESILDNKGWSFYDHLNAENREIIKEIYPNEVENAINFSRK
jgi:ankyrin repeat protein